MSIKQIMEMAGNEEVMDLLREIAEIQTNMVYKTIHEQETAKKRMKSLAKIIKEEMEG